MATTISVTPGDIGQRINSTIMDLGVFTFDTGISNYVAGQSYTFTVNSAYQNTFTKANVKQGDYITNVDVGGLTTPYFVITAINGYVLTVKAMVTTTDSTPASWSDEHIVRPAGLLSYSITTDGTMSTITEKVNGTTVNTRTATSGQAITLGLTQAQWDAIRFGKYTEGFNSYISNVQSDWEQSYRSSNVGSTADKLTDTTIISLKNSITQKVTSYRVKCNSNYQMFIIEVDSSNVVVSKTGWINNGTTFTTKQISNNLYVMLRKSNVSTIAVNDVVNANPLLVDTFSNNTLTVEMGSEKWTYTFDKRLATDADILSAVKATQDSNEIYLPAVKKQLADAINAKGGSASASDSLEVLASKITSSTAVNYKTGQSISPSTTKSFTTSTGSVANSAYVSIDFSQIGFSPKYIFIKNTDLSGNITSTVWSSSSTYVNGVQHSNVITDSSRFRSPATTGITDIPVVTSGISYTWEAYQ